MTRQSDAVSRAASEQVQQAPNAWQASKQHCMSSFGVHQEAYALAERKLSGDRLAEAKQWIYRQRRDDRIRAFMARLEPLPDKAAT